MKIHFIGIGGIGVSALAQYYLAKGHQVSGSDLVASEMTDLLKTLGAKVYIGAHQRKCLTRNVKQVVYSPAVKKNNPELREAEKRELKIQSYPEALGELTKKYFTIAVCGTHGKSTTASMVALILIKAGLDPTVIIGTKLKEFVNDTFSTAVENVLQKKGSNFWMGKRNSVDNRKYLVIEADEWGASFLNYWPRVIVLTNIEKEHMDYYKDMKHVLNTYKEFLLHLEGPKGRIIANQDDKQVYRIAKEVQKEYPIEVDWYSLRQKEKQKMQKILKIPGNYNIANALAGLSAIRYMGVPDKIAYEALSEYQGSWRRFETKMFQMQPSGESALRPAGFRFQVISDYAHHPTEIEACLGAVREKWPEKEVWLVFQPHQYQRTFYLFNDFVKIFKKASVNKAIITDIYDVAGRENKGIKGKISAKKLVEAIGKKEVIYLKKDKISPYLRQNLQGKEIIVIMGAGDIYKLINKN